VSADDPGKGKDSAEAGAVVDDLANACRRRDEYAASLDVSLKEREGSIPRRMRSTNASANSKLTKIYALMDELGAAAKDFVACRNGCSACCHMNVTISVIEAKQIETATGRARATLSSSRIHNLGEFSGRPCPFLKDSSCGIYPIRPFACRKHVSFDTTSFWCQPERSHVKEMPMIGFSGVEEAYSDVSGRNSNGIFADIRDFFPG